MHPDSFFSLTMIVENSQDGVWQFSSTHVCGACVCSHASSPFVYVCAVHRYAHIMEKVGCLEDNPYSITKYGYHCIIAQGKIYGYFVNNS